MNSTTLRGIFPEPKPVYKRNFIKENVKHIKQMQGILQNQAIFENKTVRNRPQKVLSQSAGEHKIKSGLSLDQALSQSKSLKDTKQLPILPKKRKQFTQEKAKGDSIVSKDQIQISELSQERQTHRAVQTLKSEDVTKLYDTGVIKYPSPAVLEAIARRSPRRQLQSLLDQDRGDTGDSPTEEGLDVNNYIKQNIMAIKQKSVRQESNPEPEKVKYQKGVVPKYLRERKEQKKAFENDVECPEGHVLLPEEERKETLRVLRQSYADRIQELNSMPVRSDTLRMRNRKMAIEEELKKIDEGIKVFQRPKVFVKINA